LSDNSVARFQSHDYRTGFLLEVQDAKIAIIPFPLNRNTLPDENICLITGLSREELHFLRPYQDKVITLNNS